MKTGEIIWKYSSDHSAHYPNTDQKSFMNYSFPAPPSGQLVEKVLRRPVVFDNILYFTTFAYKGKATGCSVEGDARLYVLYFQTGGGALDVDDLSDLQGTPSSQRYITIGQGVPSNPVISVDNKGIASVAIGTTNSQIYSDQVFSSGTGKSILYWREVTRNGAERDPSSTLR
jgi:hypothetical protein